ncbi:MAG: hypothetical protein R2802_00450 [Flavobacteriaceae bacterium]
MGIRYRSRVATEIPVNPGTWEPRNWTLVSNLPDGRLIVDKGFLRQTLNGDCTYIVAKWNSFVWKVRKLRCLIILRVVSSEMVFSHNISTEAAWDGGNLKYNLNGGGFGLLFRLVLLLIMHTMEQYTDFFSENTTQMQGEEAFTGSDGSGSSTGSWGRSFIDLSALGAVANSTIQFRWEMGSDGCNGRIGWYLDEISIYNCDEPLSVDEFTSLKESSQVYPNPSNGTFQY